MPQILLATLNARYAHASLGLRYLRANLRELREHCAIREFIIGQKTEEIVEKLLAEQPRVIGFGVYIWNVEETTRIVAQLKVVAPEVVVVLGGPEVSYEVDEQRICKLADYVVTGWGDVTFAKLVRQILFGPKPLMKVHAGEQPPLDQLVLPYSEYTDEDVRNRHLYVEASRGCPFKCEFCLSALDKTAWPFPLEAFLRELEQLYQRGARQFKFVDRTFNLKIETSLAIMNFFLQKLEAAPNDPPFLHFELIPDHLPERLKSAIAKFPEGTLQFEIGIQSFNPEVQQTISRKQNNEAAAENLRWLREQSRAHLHVDLIAGLPGEDIASFAAGFDKLVRLNPHEIQFGILKRLRGTPIIRHTQDFAMRYNPEPPYNILANDRIDFASMQRLVRFARYWDLVANSGRFARALPLLLGLEEEGETRTSAFYRFLTWADWLYAETGRTHAIATEKLYDLLHAYLTTQLGVPAQQATEALVQDYVGSGARGRLSFVDVEQWLRPQRAAKAAAALAATPTRQARHLRH